MSLQSARSQNATAGKTVGRVEIWVQWRSSRGSCGVGSQSGEDKQHPPTAEVKLITEMRLVVGVNRFSQMAGPASLSPINETLQRPVLIVKMWCIWTLAVRIYLKCVTSGKLPSSPFLSFALCKMGCYSKGITVRANNGGGQGNFFCPES